MMKKKVKKIPKYNAGGSIFDTVKNNNPLKGNPITFNPAGSTNDNSTNNFSKFSNWKGTSANPWKDMTSAQKTGAVIDAVGAIGQGLGVATSGQDVNVGTALSTAASMAGVGMTFGGPIGAGIGAGVGAIMGTAGRKAGYDADSSSTNFNDIYDPGSGWLGLLSDKDKAQRKANIVQNSNISKIQSENIKEMYYSDPNVTLQPTTAAEGGIMRQPVDALVSKGELIYNPMTKKLSKVPGSKGKPNKADDVYARLYEGDVVISNSPTMLMANGKTPAQNLEGLVDRKPIEQEIHTDGFRARTPQMYRRGTLGAREAIIKKVVNWQEANKTKPQEYAMYGEGTGENGAEEKPIKKRRNSIWNRLQDKWNAAAINDWFENYYNNIDKYEDHAIIDGRLFIKHDGKWYDSHKGGLGNALKGNVLPESGKGDMTDRYRMVPFKQGVYVDVDKSKIVRHKTNNTAVDNITKQNSNVGVTSNPELDFVSFRHTTPNYTVQELDIVNDKDNIVPNSPKKDTVNKPSSGKKTTTSRVTTQAVPQEEKATPEQIAEFLRNEDIGERHWLRGPVHEPKQSFTSLAKITPEKIKSQGVNNVAPLTGVKPLTDTTGTDDTGYTGSDWRDNLYRMMVLTQPFWDKATAEPVNYESPVYKYMPTQIDVTSQFRDTDQSYALAKYNFANLYPNTGAGMAAGLQAAANRAKQYADIRQYQTNAQNELIGKNVGIYNNFANEHARIMNEVYNKTAANRAAARNINRQNRAEWLSNWGTILRDDKQFAADSQNKALQTEVLKPLIQSVYENSDTLIPMLAQYTANKNIKKKSPTR